MNNLEKSRTQRDARRTVAHRTTSTTSEQAILSYLGVELYRDRRRTQPAPDRAEGETTEAQGEK